MTGSGADDTKEGCRQEERSPPGLLRRAFHRMMSATHRVPFTLFTVGADSGSVGVDVQHPTRQTGPCNCVYKIDMPDNAPSNTDSSNKSQVILRLNSPPVPESRKSRRFCIPRAGYSGPEPS